MPRQYVRAEQPLLAAHKAYVTAFDAYAGARTVWDEALRDARRAAAQRDTRWFSKAELLAVEARADLALRARAMREAFRELRRVQSYQHAHRLLGE